MSVLADADAGDVDRRYAQQLLEPRDFGVRIGRLAVHLVERLHGPGSLGDETLAHVAAERRLVGGRDADVFVEMKTGNLRPVDIRLFHESLEKFKLTRACRDNDPRLAAEPDRFADFVARHLRRMGRHILLIVSDIHLHFNFLYLLTDTVYPIQIGQCNCKITIYFV